MKSFHSSKKLLIIIIGKIAFRCISNESNNLHKIHNDMVLCNLLTNLGDIKKNIMYLDVINSKKNFRLYILCKFGI